MASPGPEPAPHRLTARAELGFALRDGKTRLTRSLAEPPLLVQRALYLDDRFPDLAFLFLLNPTPGLFQGDTQTIEIDAGPGSRVHLTTPSASKVYAMPDRDARQTLEIQLAEAAYLEYLPEPLIPFRGSGLCQRTRARLAPGAALALGEVVVPGRVASGESFAYRFLDRRLTVTGPAGQPLFHEASRLAPQSISPLTRAVLPADRPVLGTLLVAAPGRDLTGLGEGLSRCLPPATENREGLRAGQSTLTDGQGLVIKVLAPDSRTVQALFRRCVETVRSHFLGKDPGGCINPAAGASYRPVS